MNPTRTSAVLMERRQSSRLPANSRGVLSFGNSQIPCTIIDISAGGAGLTIEGGLELPAEFSLLIDGEAQVRQCRLAWSDNGRLGVSFE